MDDLRPSRTAQFLLGLAEQQDDIARPGEAHRDPGAHVVDDTEHADLRGGQDVAPARLVVEADVAAGHRRPQRQAAVHQALDRLDELPHHLWVFGGTEVQAVGDRHRLGAAHRDIAVGLRQCQLGTQVGVQLTVASIGIGGQCDAEVGVLVDTHHAGVVGLGQHRVATHEAVVLVGHPTAVAQVRRTHQAQNGFGELLSGVVARQMVRVVGVEGVQPLGTPLGAVIGRALVGNGPRIDIDDAFAVPVDEQPVTGDQFTDDRGLDIPLGADLEELVDICGLADGHHAFLRLAHQDLFGSHRLIPQRHQIELTVHAAVACRGQLTGGAGDAGGAQVLDRRDHAGGEELQGALDEQLLHERVADLHRRTLRRFGVVERLGRQDGRPSDAVCASSGTVEDDLVAGTGRLGELQVFVAHDADAQRVDQRVVVVAGVEVDLAADVRKAQAIAVATHTGDDARQHTAGVGSLQRTEAQAIHDCDRTGTHGEDVAHDTANPGGCTLVGLHIGRVVVRLGLEGDGVALPDVDRPSVVADAGQQRPARGRLRQRTEPLEMDLGGLVGAVLRPHHRVHGQFPARRAAPQQVADALVLVFLQAQCSPRLFGVRCAASVLNCVDHSTRLSERGQSAPAARYSERTSPMQEAPHERAGPRPGRRPDRQPSLWFG